MENSIVGLSIFDYIIFVLMLVFSSAIGIYYRFSGGRQKTNKEYFLADKNMPVIPVAFSLMASFMSAITLLGVAAENYMYGTQFAVINIAYIFGTPIAAYVFLPVFFQMQATSAFEYLEKRFNKGTRLLASAIFIFQMVLYMSIVLYAPALTLSAVSGLSKWASVLSIGIVCTFYCTIGGIKAVLWTDLFQSLLMFAAVFVVIAKGLMDAGGFANVWDIAVKGERIQFWNIDPDPSVRHSVWSLAIGGIFTYVSIYGINQSQIQRLLTVKELKTSQLALTLNWPITTLLSFVTCFAGIVVYANLHDCDPMLASQVQSPDQILPYFVMKSLSEIPGIPGLFIAGIFSGALSTMSSAINSLAAVTIEDFLRPFIFKKSSESKIALFTKLTALMYGFLCITMTYVVERLGGILQASLTIFNIVGGPMLGLFSLGMLCKKANTKGSLSGFLISLILCFWIGFGSMAINKKIPSSHLSLEGCSNFPAFNLSVFQNISQSSTNETLSVYSTIWNVTLVNSQNYTEQHFTNETLPVYSGIFNDTLGSSQDNSEYVFPLYKMSYMWYSAFGWLTCMIIGLAVSLITGKNDYVNPALLSPVTRAWSSNKGPINEAMQLAECT